MVITGEGEEETRGYADGRLGMREEKRERGLACSQVSEGPWGWAHPAHLAKPGQHDDDGGVVLPQHAPEVLGALCQRALCGYVGLLLPGVDIRLDMLEVLCSPSLPQTAPLTSPLLREAHSNLLSWPYPVVPPASQAQA